MGNIFSFDGIYFRNKSIPSEWNETPEEYEALKRLMYERMGENNELYQMLFCVNRALKGPNGPKCAKEFFEYGYVELINEIVRKKYKIPAFCDATCISLFFLSKNTDYSFDMVHTYGCFKLMTDIITKAPKRSCKNIVLCMNILAYYWDSDDDADIDTLYKHLLEVTCKKGSDPSMCGYAYFVISKTLFKNAPRNVPKFLKLGGVEKVCKLFSTRNWSEIMLEACSVLFSALTEIVEGAYEVVQMGGVELLIGSLIAVKNIGALECGLSAITSIVTAEPTTCVRALDLGILGVIQTIIRLPNVNKTTFKTIIVCLAALFSIDVTFKSERHEEARAIVNIIRDMYPTSKTVQLNVDSFNRVEDPKARECREAHICTRMGIGDCLKHPSTQQCKKCYVPQFFFRCLTCSNSTNRIYCLSCMERCHKGHKGVTYFWTGRCDCENPECCKPPSSSSSNAPVDEDDDWVFV